MSKEKKRTDTLLYQMLPKAVAEQLKQNQEIATEEFVQATIMFSDIVGFTQISSRSSPLQVSKTLSKEELSDTVNCLCLCKSPSFIDVLTVRRLRYRVYNKSR